MIGNQNVDNRMYQLEQYMEENLNEIFYYMGPSSKNKTYIDRKKTHLNEDLIRNLLDRRREM